MASMGRTVGVLVGAGVLGAIYQIITEEARSQLQGIRQRAHLKRVRRDAVLIKLLGTELSPELQLALAVSRKPYETAIRLLALPQISTRDKELIRDTLQHAIKIQPSS